MEFCEILSHKVIVCNDIVNCTIIKDLTLKGKSQVCLLWTWFIAYSDLNITHFSANKQVQGIEIIQYIGKGKISRVQMFAQNITHDLCQKWIKRKRGKNYAGDQLLQKEKKKQWNKRLYMGD